ncbi:MAG: ribonuclease H-like domain-containing protein [Promethearchaeota archaeon]|jgi:uncharacterized protein YprB with RNaseH-like and TPR domain
MASYHAQGFDITPLVQQYKGKKLEDLYKENYRVVQNEMGEFMELFWQEENIPCNIILNRTRRRLLNNLKTVHYIGDYIENRLKGRGIRTLKDLKFLNLKYRDSANKILKSIKEKDYQTLKKNKYIDDLDVSFCFNLEDLLFLDIETLGLYDNAIIILGIGYFINKKYEIRLLFARGLEEEIAICEHLKNEILPKFKCFISYNGKRFDIPYIANRLLYFFDKNPMISEDRFKGLFERYTLTNIEEQLLNMRRENELPSSMVPTCYKKYQKNPNRYVGLIKECIEHNYYDVYSMPLILHKLLEI